jgi:neutral ceramidase
MTLRAGAARVDITPPPGQPMSGFPPLRQMDGGPNDIAGYVPREGRSVGTHDPLYARALVLDDGQRTLVLVAVDLIVVTSEFTAAVRAAVQEATGIPPVHILLAASHTHAGPDLFRWSEGLDPEVEPAVRRGVVQAILEAHATLRPARVGWAFVDREGLVINRRDPDGPVDPRVGVMRVEDENEAPIALTVNYAIHTCMLSGLNLFYSGDISGLAMAGIERFYPGSVALFLNGAAGNINPVAYPWGIRQNVVTAFRRAWHAGEEHPRTFRQAARMGHLLAAAAIEAAETVGQLDSAISIAAAMAPAQIPLRSVAERERFYAFTGLSAHFGSERTRGNSFQTEVQVLRIGPVSYIGLPGEPFVELGLEIQRRLGAAATYVVGYANDDVRYVLPRAAFHDIRYDAWATMLAAGSGEILVDLACSIAAEVSGATA